MTPADPLDSAALERLALHYAARYATSRAKLARYLARKIAARGWGEARPADIEALVARLAALGYVDDAALAEARGRSLARRGFGARRLEADLIALGVGPADAAEARAAAREGAWETALRFAERRRLGPFALGPTDEASRRRAFAMMIRAGHDPAHVRRILAARSGEVPVPE